MTQSPASADMTEPGELEKRAQDFMDRVAARMVAAKYPVEATHKNGHRPDHIPAEGFAWSERIYEENLARLLIGGWWAKPALIRLLMAVREETIKDTALASARAEGVSPDASYDSKAIRAAGERLLGKQAPFAPQAAETGGGQADVKMDWPNNVIKRGNETYRVASPDDADARGRELLSLLDQELSGLRPKLAKPDLRVIVTMARDWIEARLHSTPPPSEDDKKARGLRLVHAAPRVSAEMIRAYVAAIDALSGVHVDGGVEPGSFLWKEIECGLRAALSRLGTPAIPTSAGDAPDDLFPRQATWGTGTVTPDISTATDLAELFAPGQLVAVQTYDGNGQQVKLRARELTEAERELIYAGISGSVEGR